MTDYFFTITLKPTMYKHTIDIQFDQTYMDLIVLLKLISNKITMVVELTKALNVHYHGVIRLNCSRIKFVNLFRKSKEIGFVNISEVKDLQKVAVYMEKDLKTTKEELHTQPILINQYNFYSEDQQLEYGRSFNYFED